MRVTPVSGPQGSFSRFSTHRGSSRSAVRKWNSSAIPRCRPLLAASPGGLSWRPLHRHRLSGERDTKGHRKSPRCPRTAVSGSVGPGRKSRCAEPEWHRPAPDPSPPQCRGAGVPRGGADASAPQVPGGTLPAAELRKREARARAATRDRTPPAQRKPCPPRSPRKLPRWGAVSAVALEPTQAPRTARSPRRCPWTRVSAPRLRKVHRRDALVVAAVALLTWVLCGIFNVTEMLRRLTAPSERYP